MCGIVGIFRKNRSGIIEKEVIANMSRAIAHRGPDDSGYYINKFIAFAHRRLAIIDLSGGTQPMIDNIKDKVLIYNGEIYNYKEIRKKLKKANCFTTNSDTEVLLKLAEFDNFDWLQELIGMFAFALWSNIKQELLLCRDRIGIKPLYYVDLPDVLIFSSEIKAIIQYPKLDPKLNTDRVPEFIAFRNISGSETLFSDIMELPPGHTLSISSKNQNPVINKYWSPDIEQHNYENNPQNLAGFESLFETSVQDRLISDVPLGTFNSGGVDSSLVSYYVRKNKADHLHTFSVGFSEASYDESKYASYVARLLNSEHHSFLMDEEKFTDGLKTATRTLEEPLNHPHTVPLFFLCKEAKKFVSVVLTGEGADEIFAGYPRYQIPMISYFLQFIPKGIKSNAFKLSRLLKIRKLIKLLEVIETPSKASIECSRFTPLNDLFLILNKSNEWIGKREEIYAQYYNEPTFLEQLLAYERDTYLQSLLIRLDKVSMASALEARVPFLDHRLICWSRTLPINKKIHFINGNKIIVKECASKHFPRKFVNRSKVGFGVPIAEWLRNKKGLGRKLELLLDDSFKDHFPFINHVELSKMIQKHHEGSNMHTEIIWSALSLELWYQQFINNRSRLLYN